MFRNSFNDTSGSVLCLCNCVFVCMLVSVLGLSPSERQRKVCCVIRLW